MSADILRFLRKNGEQLDAQIAEALNMPIDRISLELSQLALAREIICCNLTRYRNGDKVEGVSCRLSCDTPQATRGPKRGGAKGDDAADRDEDAKGSP